MRCSLLCTLAAALIPQHRVMQRRHRVMRMAAESCEFTLKGDTVATAFFANQYPTSIRSSTRGLRLMPFSSAVP